jgi:hypothetical protein
MNATTSVLVPAARNNEARSRGAVALIALLAVLLCGAVEMQLRHAHSQIAQLEARDRTQTKHIASLVSIASDQQIVLQKATSLVSDVVGNQKTLLRLYVKSRPLKEQRLLTSAARRRHAAEAKKAATTVQATHRLAGARR